MTTALAKRNEAITRRYAAGEVVRAIAEAFGLSPSTVKHTVARAGVRRKVGDPERDRAIARRYAAGETCARIGADLGMTAATAQYHAKKGGARMRPKGRRAGQRADLSSCAYWVPPQFGRARVRCSRAMDDEFPHACVTHADLVREARDHPTLGRVARRHQPALRRAG